MLKFRWIALGALLINMSVNLMRASGLQMMVFLTLLTYLGFALAESQREVEAHDRIALPLLFFNLLGIAHLELLSIVPAAFMFRHALELYPRIAAVPFSLALGWLTLANLTGVPTLVAVALIAALGIGLNARYESLVYPMVLAWGAFQIAFAYRNDSITVHLAALAAAVVLVAWVAVAATAPRRVYTGYRYLC